jgi:peptidoglycan biosynthesis protein MviN/MurJ (putative lipid II flippase)
MADPVPDSKTPVFVALTFAATGIVFGLVFGSGGGKLFAAAIAAVGAVPAAVGMWKGIQQQGQSTLAGALGALLLSLGVALVMIVWAVIVFWRG